MDGQKLEQCVYVPRPVPPVALNAGLRSQHILLDLHSKLPSIWEMQGKQVIAS